MKGNAIVLSASNLTLAYKNEIIINNASLMAKEGDFIFITGKSGSGKTTLLKSFFGEFENFGGELYVLFKNMQKISNSELLTLRRKLGIIFQDYKLINELNVIDNIAMPLKIAGGFNKEQIIKHVDVLLKYVKLQHKAKKYPLELSGGEQQRIALARAIIHNPKIIICDEPTGNLDIHSADIIWQILDAARKSFNACIIVVTHQIPSKIDFDYRHFHIDDGVLHEFV